MRHVRFDIAHLALEGITVPLKAAYLLVAEQDGADELQWEVLAYALDPADLRRDRYEVALSTLEGRRLAGPAVLVRSVDGAHVLRGDGPLEGLAADDLSDRPGPPVA